MKNIHVRRLSTSDSLQWIIEPEDRSWLVLVDVQGEATFWRQCQVDDCSPIVDPDDGVREFYIDAELPGGPRLRVEPTIVRDPPMPDSDTYDDPVNPLDFTITPNTDTPGFWAMLNARRIACFGETEHAAIRSLLNYSVRLAVAGCLDHTGRPVAGVSKRRRDAAFPPEPSPENEPVPGLPPPQKSPW